MQTERVTFLTSREQKAELDAFAAERGESVGNVVREATARYIAQPDGDDEAELAALVEELVAALPDMKASLQRTAKRMEDTAAEVDRMLREAGVRK